MRRDARPPAPPAAQSGKTCTLEEPCPAGETCLSEKTTDTRGFCATKCWKAGADCPNPPKRAYSACVVKAGAQYYCMFICAMGSAIWNCPDRYYKCVASTSAGVKICKPIQQWVDAGFPH